MSVHKLIIQGLRIIELTATNETRGSIVCGNRKQKLTAVRVVRVFDRTCYLDNYTNLDTFENVELHFPATVKILLSLSISWKMTLE